MFTVVAEADHSPAVCAIGCSISKFYFVVSVVSCVVIEFFRYNIKVINRVVELFNVYYQVKLLRTMISCGEDAINV